MTTLTVTTRDREGGAHVELSGELDIATAPKLEEEMQRLEGQSHALVVLDLRGLEFMDSSGLRALLAVETRARAGGARVVVVRGDERIQRLLQMTRVDERLELVDDEESLAGAA
jgi:anti-sigma B factor antagonist